MTFLPLSFKIKFQIEEYFGGNLLYSGGVVGGGFKN
jgi:hypothetical protein